MTIALEPAIAIANVGRGFVVEWIVDGKTKREICPNRDVLTKLVFEAAGEVRPGRADDAWPHVVEPAA